MVESDSFGCYLSIEVDLQAGVDRDHVVILPDHIGVIRMIDGVHLDHIILIDEVIKCLRTHDDGADDLTWMQGLLLTRHIARVDHVHNAIGEHLRVQAQIFPLS